MHARMCVPAWNWSNPKARRKVSWTRSEASFLVSRIGAGERIDVGQSLLLEPSPALVGRLLAHDSSGLYREGRGCRVLGVPPDSNKLDYVWKLQTSLGVE